MITFILTSVFLLFLAIQLKLNFGEYAVSLLTFYAVNLIYFILINIIGDYNVTVLAYFRPLIALLLTLAIISALIKKYFETLSLAFQTVYYLIILLIFGNKF